MHDPLVVAFEIRRPWPRRDSAYDSVRPGRARVLPRWNVRRSPFWTLAGRGFYWPTVITVWHREPRGHDSGEVCRHFDRWQNADGKWQMKVRHSWRFHVHHWRIQVRPLQALRRWLLTRCSWCGGPSRKDDRVNISHSWDGPRGRWWRGEPGLFHEDCSSIQEAHRSCLCDEPVLEHRKWGRCARCMKFRGYGRSEAQIQRSRVLAAVPAGQRDAKAYARVCEMYKTENVAADGH